MNQNKERKSFIIHRDSLSVLKKLKDDQAGKLFKAIANYQENKILPGDELISIIFEPFFNQFKQQEKSSRKGKFHWNWRNGKSSESAIIRQSSENKNWRKSVFQRDDYICQKCSKKGVKINAHHIKEFSKYPELRFEVSNGLTLCKSCHNEIHSKNRGRNE